MPYSSLQPAPFEGGYFFEHYKDLENKKVHIGEFYGREDAIKIYIDSKNKFINKYIQKNKITNYFKQVNT